MTIKDKKNQILLLTISLIFYLFFFFLDGYVICADSNSYINMYFFREPLYPLYLAVWRLLLPFSETFYLQIAVLGQSLLAAYTSYSLANYVRKECILPYWSSYILLSFMLITSLLCRLIAKRHSMYSNSILSEGLAISIYLLFIRFCFEYLIYKNQKSFVICCILCFLGISCRKQMIVLLILFLLSILYTHRKKYLLRGFLLSFITAFITLSSIILFDCGYNFLIRGQFDGHVDDNRFLTTIAIYASNREFVNYIQDKEIQQVFLNIYDICEDKGYLMHQAPKNWYDSCDHFANNYDLIQIDTMLTYLNNTISNLNYANEISSKEIRIDLIKAEINRALLPHEIPRIFKIVKNNFLDGLVNTVAKRTPLLCLYSIIAYCIYLFLYFILVFETKKKGFTPSCKPSLIFSSFVIASILTNNLIVSSVIFSQTRYVIYNMPLFYISIFTMILELHKLKIHK